MGGRWPWAVVIGAAVLAFVAGIGTGLSPAAPPKPTPSTVRTSRPSPSPGVLAELARPQRADERPTIPVGHRLRASTFRVIDSSVLSNVYVARDVDGRICIVAIPIDDQFSAACGAGQDALPTPLLLLYTVIPPGQGPVAALAGVDRGG